MEFTAVLRRTATNNGYDFDDEFIRDFMNAWDYCSTHPNQYLFYDFGTSQAREAWLGMAKAYGATLDEPVEVRRVKHTDSSSKENGKLHFVMEAKTVAEARRKRAREASLDREKRRANGEEIRRGRRPRTVTNS